MRFSFNMRAAAGEKNEFEQFCDHLHTDAGLGEFDATTGVGKRKTSAEYIEAYDRTHTRILEASIDERLAVKMMMLTFLATVLPDLI